MGGAVICAITFISIATYRDWPDAMIARLRLVGEIFAAAIERKRAEAALRKSEEQFRQMAENIREVSWLTTADMTKMLYISPAYEVVWGQSRDSLYLEPRSFFTAIHAEDRSRVVSIIERDRERGFEAEYRVVRPDGSIRWVWDRGFPIKDESGRFYRLVGIAEDITERKEAEDALRRSEDRLRLVIDTVPALIHTGLPDGQLDFFNQRWLDFVGLSLEDLSGWKWTAAIHPEDVAAMVERWRAALATGAPYEHEARVRRADGEYRWMVHREVPLRDERGNIVKWYASSIDIEDRKRAEDALRQSEDHLRLVIDTIPMMAWSVRPDGIIDFLNQRWLDYCGLSLEQYVQDPTGPIHPEDIPRVLKEWRANMAVGEPYEIEMRLRRADGKYRWFLVRTAPLRDEQGYLIKWYGVSIDIDEHKRAEALLHAKELEFRAIVENTPDLITRYDREFRRTYANPALSKSYDLPMEALIGKPMFSIIRDAGLDVKEDELTQVRQRFQHVFDTGESCVFELTLPMPTGNTDYSVRLFPERGLNGSVINVLSIARDITASKRAEEELKKEKEILEKIFENIPVMIGFVGEDGRVKLVNPEWERTMGWTLNELQEQTVDIFAEAYPDLPYRQEVLDFVAAATGEWVDLKIRVRDGRLIDAACAVVYLSDGTKIAIAQDITERKGAEERIRATSEQLRALSTSLRSAKEEEGTRIARELHDELGSALTSFKWDLEEMVKVVSGPGDQVNRVALRERMVAMTSLIETTIHSLRRISSELRPTILDDLGLVPAIEWQAQQFESHTGIICQCDCFLDNGDLTQDQATALFRIVQEAMTNVLRHAQASRVNIALEEEAGEFVLRVRDDGRGITEEERTGLRSLGLMGMRERAHLIGGTVEITGVEGKGTVLTVRVPLRVAVEE
jgi:PAS domain S-box-containing protein